MRMRAKLGPDHPRTLESMNSLALSYTPSVGTPTPSNSMRRRWR